MSYSKDELLQRKTLYKYLLYSIFENNRKKKIKKMKESLKKSRKSSEWQKLKYASHDK